MPVLNDAYNLRFASAQVLGVMHRGVEVWTLPVPANTVAPVLSGGTSAPADLSVTNGTWTNSPTGYRYQWQELLTGVWTDLGGETASTYTTDHAGEFRCVVIAESDFGDSNPANSNSLVITAGGTGYFGIQTIGANTYPASDDRYVAARFYLDRNATITEIAIYTAGSGGVMKGAIWADNAGEPGAIVAVADETAVVANGWTICPVTGGVPLAEGWYYIGEVSGGFYSSMRHNLVSGNAMRANNSGNYDVPGNWPGSGTFTYDSQLSAYANYEY